MSPNQFPTPFVLQAVEFGSLPIGAWFKELLDGPWHMKTSAGHGEYQSWGTRYQPAYAKGETVHAEPPARVCA